MYARMLFTAVCPSRADLLSEGNSCRAIEITRDDSSQLPLFYEFDGRRCKGNEQ